jgi:hypothetical protein
MTITITLTLMVVAFVLLLLEALKIGNSRISFGWLGLALWALSLIFVGK